jgi:hypothetical protein
VISTAHLGRLLHFPCRMVLSPIIVTLTFITALNVIWNSIHYHLRQSVIHIWEVNYFVSMFAFILSLVGNIHVYFQWRERSCSFSLAGNMFIFNGGKHVYFQWREISCLFSLAGNIHVYFPWQECLRSLMGKIHFDFHRRKTSMFTFTGGKHPYLLSLVGNIHVYFHWWETSMFTFTGGKHPCLLSLVGNIH